jgi:hypothetical protein
MPSDLDITLSQLENFGENGVLCDYEDCFDLAQIRVMLSALPVFFCRRCFIDLILRHT